MMSKSANTGSSKSITRNPSPSRDRKFDAATAAADNLKYASDSEFEVESDDIIQAGGKIGLTLPSDERTVKEIQDAQKKVTEAGFSSTPKRDGMGTVFGLLPEQVPEDDRVTTVDALLAQQFMDLPFGGTLAEMFELSGSVTLQQKVMLSRAAAKVDSEYGKEVAQRLASIALQSYWKGYVQGFSDCQIQSTKKKEANSAATLLKVCDKMSVLTIKNEEITQTSKAAIDTSIATLNQQAQFATKALDLLEDFKLYLEEQRRRTQASPSPSLLAQNAARTLEEMVDRYTASRPLAEEIKKLMREVPPPENLKLAILHAPSAEETARAIVRVATYYISINMISYEKIKSLGRQ